MPEIAISVENISKKYIIHHEVKEPYKRLSEVITRSAKSWSNRVFGKKKAGNDKTIEEFWALKDINFEVKEGERVGIIGRNGAGKSTLLKVLSRITEPSKGRITVKGRVSSILEVGTGFHPELTGRENIFLNGAILGMTKGEIKRKFDEIVAFSEIERFLDTPVKRYSSGMYVRLAFAVAAHLEPDILIVDEVLAVGDANFQKKCLGKMDDVSKSGRTILFVSHNMRAVRTLCESGVLIEKGKTIGKMPIEDAIHHYTSQKIDSQGFPLELNQEVIVHDFQVTQEGESRNVYDGDHPIDIKIKVELLKDLTDFRTGIIFKSSYGDVLFYSFTSDWNPEYETLKKGVYSFQGQLPERMWNGNFIINLHLSRYGVIDYLSQSKKEIAIGLFIQAPQKFREAHNDEANRPEFGFVINHCQWKLPNNK